MFFLYQSIVKRMSKCYNIHNKTSGGVCMNYEDVEKISNAAKGKISLLNQDFFKYFVRAVMAGFFIVVAMIFSNVVGSVFSKTMPEWGKFLGAIVFAIAVLLISFVGGELFTGNNMVMAFAHTTGK